MTEPSPRYTIYLLTVWFDGPNNPGNASNPARWRFRLENPRTKEGKGFVGVEALMVGLANTIHYEMIEMRSNASNDTTMEKE